jgi:large subunit ribosomal protein L15
MVVRRATKSKKRRGTRTEGWGAGKKHRGHGHKGGHGASGVGKRGAQRKSKYLAKKKVPYGRVGIRNRRINPEIKAISLKNLDQILDKLVSQKLADKQGDSYTIDISKIKFDKILATGKITKKVNIICKMISPLAKEKVEAAGGSVKIPKATVTETKTVEEQPEPEETKEETATTQSETEVKEDVSAAPRS